MPCCSAYKCHYKSGDKKSSGNLSFHRFPKDKDLKREWIRNTGRANFQPSESAILCSCHFEDDCFKTPRTERPRLKDDAIPTIFKEIPEHLQKEIKLKSFRRSASKLRSDDWEKKIAKKKCDRLKEKKRQQKLLLKLQKNVFLDHCYSFGDVQTLERKFMENTERLETLQKKLKIQLARNCQFKKDVNFMKEVIDDLREQKFVKKGDTEILQDFNGIAIPDLLFRRNKTNQLLNKHNREAYSPEIRKFAETLSSISMKAYEYVRKTFNFALPCPTTLRNWHSTTDGAP
uniref:THAP-type domain-containing protein n=1 Tax=Lepeophtheirus salmonis TaxID=72036 RepID=A0A0K2TS66_LEPSM|nr:THAP domain-containing protein 2-like [Lepeophtheirus salmonis]XP_040571856.1 THAP domain-containing protein 2-like [Lepeophtheirus salmonis]